MRADLEIVDLAGHPELLDRVLRWKQATWPEIDRTREDQTPARRVFDAARPAELPRTLVALSGGEPVGFVSLIELRVAASEPLRSWVDALYVLPERRGKGIALRLLVEAESLAGKLGLQELSAYTDQISLYRRAGWGETEPSPSAPLRALRKSIL